MADQSPEALRRYEASFGLPPEGEEQVPAEQPEAHEGVPTELPRWAESLSERVGDFFRTHFKGERGAESTETRSETRLEHLTDVLINVAKEVAGVFKLGTVVDAARLVSQKYHERMEEREIVRKYTEALGVEFGAEEPERRDLEEARVALRERIEESTLLSDEQKWELLRKLSELLIAQDGSLRAYDESTRKAVDGVVTQHIESPLKAKKVLVDLALAVLSIKFFPVKILKLGKVGYKSAKHIRTGLLAMREATE